MLCANEFQWNNANFENEKKETGKAPSTSQAVPTLVGIKLKSVKVALVFRHFSWLLISKEMKNKWLLSSKY